MLQHRRIEAMRHIADIVDLIRRMRFDNRRFWNDRYSTNMDKGSGPGSRGIHLELKSRIIRGLVDRDEIASVLDIGCGDIEILRDVKVQKYTGIDISDVVIRRNRTLRPDWAFVCADVATDHVPKPADLVLCLDVLIHQKHLEAYTAIVSKAVHATRKIALFSGYAGPPPDGWNVWFHEPLRASLSRVSGNARLTKLDGYRSTELWELRRGDV
jgi:SAM-dependent methyltransferase